MEQRNLLTPQPQQQLRPPNNFDHISLVRIDTSSMYQTFVRVHWGSIPAPHRCNAGSSQPCFSRQLMLYLQIPTPPPAHTSHPTPKSPLISTHHPAYHPPATACGRRGEQSTPQQCILGFERWCCVGLTPPDILQQHNNPKRHKDDSYRRCTNVHIVVNDVTVPLCWYAFDLLLWCFLKRGKPLGARVRTLFKLSSKRSRYRQAVPCAL